MFTLGNYSAYSFQEAVWPVGELVERACQAGYTGVGLADTGSFHGAVECSQACDRAGVRMILGCRVRLRDFAPGWVQVTVRDQKGYAAVCRFLGECCGGESDEAALTRLQREAAGHIWVSCPIRVDPVLRTRIGDYPRWRAAWERLAAKGWDNLWLELGWQNDSGRLLQRRVFSDLRESGWKRWVLMSAARHGGDEKGPALLELLQSIGTLTRIRQAHPDKLPNGDYRLLSPAELQARFRKVPEVFRQTQDFARSCSFDFSFGKRYLPNPLLKSGADDAQQAAGKRQQDRLLAWRCLRGLVSRYGSSYPWSPKPARRELLERLGRELGIVAETGYAGYFLIFAEVVDECRSREIPILARGSAAGSLICYALGVANVCPFRFGLQFERFLNRERMRHSKLPDIDLDLPWDRRDEIISWLYERYGTDKVAMIGGFAHFKGRAAVAEVAKAMGVPAHEAHAWSKRLPHGSLRKFLAARDDFVEARSSWGDDRFREAVERAIDLDGLPRHPMMHPCGMVIADRCLNEFSPVVPSAKGFTMTQLSMDPVEDLGLLKMDLLGQAGLSVIRDCLEDLRQTQPELSAYRLSGEIDYGDDRIYGMIRKGEARGVFHIESPAMTSLLKLCRCADIDCLVATVSVIRPGAANEDKKTRYARRYLGLEEPSFAHPVLEEVLGDSYGLMIYEEHILLVANRFAGMDFGTADLLRRILIKKADAEALDELEAVFQACARHKGRSEEEIDTVWRELRDFSGFMFNKAHGAAYAVEAFHGCWLKFHWPVSFLAAVLNNRRGFYAPLVYVLEIIRYGGAFVLPDVQYSKNRYVTEGKRVRIPLREIKGLGSGFLGRWERACEHGCFAGWTDFLERTAPDAADAEVLARAGALRGFFENRHEAVWQAGQVRSRARMRGREAAQADLFASGPEIGRAGLDPMPLSGRAEMEAELLGYPVSLTPFALWMAGINRNGTIPLAELDRYVGREMEISGIQVCHRLHRTLKGGLMKFISFADESGIAETVLFPETYRRFGWALSQTRAARVRVYVEHDETGSGLSLTVTDLSCPD